MRLSLIKIVPLPEKRQEVLDILLSMKGPTQASVGCMNCSIYVEHGEDQAILYIEQWRSIGEMHRQMRSSLYARLLEGMELSSTVPEVCIYEVASTCGLELIEAVRRPKAGKDETVDGELTQRDPS
ncbi:putative quinol monooxygenase [Desulfuromonas sp. TF]|uniref:putative quinol monooxygenase n=1 Tax=Desulfuromonas sp. TF TaxID=1232410 RepID=UPI0004237741|nr:antibiotic biosynthesis monooxygenase [Desulfuromonas sp. TF]